MNRSSILLGVLAVVLIVVLWFIFLFKPASDELAEVNDEIVATQDQQQQLRIQLERLRNVRDDVPAIEATLAAYEALIPSDPALPALLRQLQTAADDSGMVLERVAPSEPSDIDQIEGVQSISLAIELSGGYYQLVDFLRRVEDPAITPRAVLFADVTMSVDEYPTLAVSATATMFTTAPETAGEAPPPDESETADETAENGESPTATESPNALANTEVAR